MIQKVKLRTARVKRIEPGMALHPRLGWVIRDGCLYFGNTFEGCIAEEKRINQHMVEIHYENPHDL
jgi:hypothetical protein